MNLKLLGFRLKIRKTLSQGTIEMLDIIKDELKKEYEKRNKKK